MYTTTEKQLFKRKLAAASLDFLKRLSLGFF